MAKSRRPVPSKKRPNRPSVKGVSISPASRVSLYAQARYLPKDFRKDAKLQLPFVTYFQDPFVAKADPRRGFDEEVYVDWEPGFADGPTSSRFAIVDFNGDTNTLERPAVWDMQRETFLTPDGKPVDRDAVQTMQFQQVSVWALLQCALAFFEDSFALGRRIPWAFEGNRLIVVPHAGYGENAYYDRGSKSLQFYYFNDQDAQTVYTCLSSDIVYHEFGHAVLDGIRPLYNESINPQTAAFHEFVGDLTAILLTLKNKELRHQLAESARGKFTDATALSSLAEEFGQAVKGRPYLRSARNTETMTTLKGETSPHRLSEVLTGAVFDALIAIGEIYETRATRHPGAKPKSNKQIFWDAADRMQRTAIQPLDLLPPVDVTFRDYAYAVCRSQELSDPLDPEGYRNLLIEVFVKRKILGKADAEALRRPHYLYERADLSVRHSIDDISRSRASAYRFLDDNREDLLIPARRDFFVADLYDAKKRFRQNQPLPRQVVLQYVWREEVFLEGERFGAYAGRTTAMLCGGTLVFNENGNVLSWMAKPGSLPFDATGLRGQTAEWASAVKEGLERRAAFLDSVAVNIAAGRVGSLPGSPKGLMGSFVPPLIAEEDGDAVTFRLSPHLHLSEEDQLAAEAETGGRRWQISC